MKKITFLMLHLNYGGLEKQTITLVNELAKNKEYDIEIVSVYDLLKGKSFYSIDKKVKVTFLSKFGPDHKAIYEAKKNIKVLKLIKELVKAVASLKYKYIDLRKYIKKVNTDIFISTRIEFAKMIKRRDTINISQEHSYINTDKYINKVRKSFNNINYIVVMTDKAKEDYKKWLKSYNSYSNIINIPNMINVKTDKKTTLKNNQIISIGRLEKEKDFISLIEMFHKLCEKNDKLKLKIIGDGKQRRELEGLVNKLKLQTKVIFTGKLEQQQVENELLNSDIFVLTSFCESFSLVLIEAMAIGLPCISFDIDVGPKILINNEKNGYLIKNRNIDDMADKIYNLLNNEAELKRMSYNSLISIEKYKPEKVVTFWEGLFGDTIE